MRVGQSSLPTRERFRWSKLPESTQKTHVNRKVRKGLHAANVEKLLFSDNRIVTVTGGEFNVRLLFHVTLTRKKV